MCFERLSESCLRLKSFYFNSTMDSTTVSPYEYVKIKLPCSDYAGYEFTYEVTFNFARWINDPCEDCPVPVYSDAMIWFQPHHFQGYEDFLDDDEWDSKKTFHQAVLAGYDEWDSKKHFIKPFLPDYLTFEEFDANIAIYDEDVWMVDAAPLENIEWTLDEQELHSMWEKKDEPKPPFTQFVIDLRAGTPLDGRSPMEPISQAEYDALPRDGSTLNYFVPYDEMKTSLKSYVSVTDDEISAMSEEQKAKLVWRND